MHEAVPILLGVLVIGVFVVWAVAGNKAEHKDIEDWAVHNGFHLLKVKRRLALLSPFRWDLSMQVNKRENPYVFYVEVLTQERRIRHAWVRVNMGWPGIGKDTVDVRWAK